LGRELSRNILKGHGCAIHAVHRPGPSLLHRLRLFLFVTSST
jgi:hypothetical protein